MKNRRNHFIKSILSIILSISIALGGMPGSIFADETYNTESTAESSPDESQIDWDHTDEPTEETDTKGSSENNESEETNSTDAVEEKAPETGKKSGNSGDAAQGTQAGNSDSAPQGTVEEETNQKEENETNESVEYTDRYIDITFNNKDHNGVVTENVINNEAVVYVGDTLTAVLNTFEGSNVSDAEASAYTYEWQIQDENDPEVYYSVPNGNGMDFTPMEEGIYRLYVYRPADDVNYINAYEGYFGQILANLIPVTVTWNPAKIEKEYDGKSTVSYSGTRTVTRDDDDTEIENFKETVSGIILDTLNSDVDSYSVSMAGVGTDLSEDVYSVSENEVTVNIEKAVITAALNVSGKNYDGSDDVETVPAVDSWTLSGTELEDKQLELCVVNDDQTVRDIQASDFKYESKGNVKEDTEVGFGLAEGINLGVKVNGQYDSHYEVDIGAHSKATISANTFGISDCVKFENTDTDIWVNKSTYKLTAKKGYTIAADENQEFAKTADAAITAENGIEFYAKNNNGDIASVQIPNIKSDTNNVAIKLGKLKNKLFDGKNVKVQFVLTDKESGIDSVKYAVAKNRDAEIAEGGWTEVTVGENNKELSIELTVPRDGYVCFSTKDIAGNESQEKIEIPELEKKKPTLEINTDEGALKTAAKEHEISITATDLPDDNPSGIQRIEYKLTDPENKEVTADVSAIIKSANPSDVQYTQNSNIISIESENEDFVLKSADITLNFAGNVLDGKYTLTLTAFDNCGNACEKVTALSFDCKAPEITVNPENGNKGNDGTWYFNAGEGQQISVSFSDTNEKEFKVTLTGPDGTKKEASLGNSEGDEGVFIVDTEAHTLTISETSLKTMTEGRYSLEFYAIDEAGNETSSASLLNTGSESGEESGSEGNTDKDCFTEFNFVIDRTAPSVTEIGIETEGIIKAQNYEGEDLLKFSKPFSVTVAIKEENLDADLIKPAAGTEEGGDAAGSSAAAVTGPEKDSEPNTWKVTFSLSESGKMIPSVTGTDLAGNPIKLSDELKCTVPEDSDYSDETSTNNGSTRTIESWWEESESENKVLSARTLVYSDKKPSITLKYYKKQPDDSLCLIGKENTQDERTAYYNDAIRVEASVENFEEHEFECITVAVYQDSQKIEEKTLKEFLGNNLEASGSDSVFTRDFTDEANYSITFKAVDFEKTLQVIEESPYENGADQETDVKDAVEPSQGETPTNWILVIDTTAPKLSGEIIPDKDAANKDTIKTKIGKEVYDRYYFNKGFEYNFVIEDNLDPRTSMIHITQYVNNLENNSSGTDGAQDGNTEGAEENSYKEIVVDENNHSEPPAELDIVYDENNKQYTCSGSVIREGAYVFYAYGTDLAGNPIEVDKKGAFAYSSEETGEDSTITKYYTYTTVVDFEGPAVNDIFGPEVDVQPTIPTDLYCNNGRPLYSTKEGDSIEFTVKAEDPIKKDGEEKDTEARSGLSSITYQLYECREAADPETGEVKTITDTLVFEPAEPIWQYDAAKEDSEEPAVDYQGTFDLPVNKNMNRNNLILVVKVTDRAGNEGTSDYCFGIDNAKPEIKVEFDNDSVKNEIFFKAKRTATITVSERNFVEDKIKIRIQHDGRNISDDNSDSEIVTFSEWSGPDQDSTTVNGDKDSFTRTVEFKADGEYTFKITGESSSEAPADAAGNLADGVTYEDGTAAPELFRIDTKSPEIVVRYDKNDVRNGKYFKSDRTATIEVTELNFIEKAIDIHTKIDKEGLEKEGEIIGSGWSSNADKHIKTITFNGDGDFEFNFNSAADAAGNPVDLKNVQYIWTDEEGKTKPASAPNEFTIDTQAPTVTVTMNGNENNGDFYYREDNCGIEVSIDDHGHSILLGGTGSDFPVYKVSVDGKVFGELGNTTQGSDIVNFDENKPSELGFVFSWDGKINELKDGTHTITVNVTDVAGNPADIIFNGCKKNENKSEEASFILDKTAPVFTVNVSSEKAKNKELNSSQGNRYYFNADYEMTVTVTDSNLDLNRISVMRGTDNCIKDDGTTKDSSSADITQFSKPVAGQLKADNDPTAGEYTDKVSQNGVYRYAIYGSDKAGNALTVKKDKTDNIDGSSKDVVDAAEQKRTGSVEDTADLTNHIVVDTVAPVGTYEVSNTKDTYYTMKQDGQVTFAEPYRQETSAQVQIKVDTAAEMTPVRVQYAIDAAPQRYSESYDSGEYKYGIVVTNARNGKQKFRLSSLTLTDLAGNVSTPNSGYTGNYIHLDYDIPVVDSIAPTINIITTATADCRDGNGQPLFNSDVPLSITVSDPDGGQSSSGLAEVTYEMYINETLAGTKTLRGGNQKNYTQSYTDPTLYFSQTFAENVGAASHNYNNLRVLVTATDNAGFRSTGEYRFGIDITPPTISVTYDNNDAQNEKYFNADRTATVVVTERNFEAERISIDTQTASISGWSHASGPSSNGDDDTWTATISYTADGNYTLAVSGSDRLGWTAGDTTYNGTAPTDFVLDKTAPVITITYDNNDVRNEKYYKADRTATITVTDVNFNGANAITVNASGGGQAPGVAFSGNSASLPFTTDGIYSFNGTVTDLAGNVSAVFTEPEFVVDKTKPQISITGVENLSANQVPLNIILTMLDTNLNEGSIVAALTGTNSGSVDISGKKTFIAGGVQYTLDTIQVDDYYQLVFTGIDLAGNEETITISFSENQNGTTFEFVQKDVAGKYTNKTFRPEFILHNVDVVTILSVTVNGKEVEYEYRNNTLTLKDEITADGKYVISIITKDAAGNVSTMDPVEFYLDQKAPVISQKGLESTSNGNYKKVYSTPFDLTILHDIPDDSFVAVKVNGKELKPSEYTINADGSITLAIDKYQKYDIEVIVTDAAGNEASAKWEFELTKNPFKLWFSNKPLFYGSLAGMLLLLFLIILLLKRRKDDDKEKEAKK